MQQPKKQDGDRITGQRWIEGKLCLLSGRYFGESAKAEAQAHAKRERAQGFFARVIKRHSWDYLVYRL